MLASALGVDRRRLPEIGQGRPCPTPGPASRSAGKEWFSAYTQEKVRIQFESSWGEGMPYRINSPQVISETVAEETIIVNLATGHYFNLQGTAVEIWDALERGEDVDGIVDSLGQRYEAANGAISEAVDELVQSLVDNDLIVADESREAIPAAAAGSRNGDGGRLPFVAPSFTTFTDMQDIILLDPVHEVDSRGWPHTAEA
jgi:hypothetical protein